MKSKRLKITTASIAIITALIVSWATYNREGYIWLIGPGFVAVITIVVLFLFRGKEWRYDERDATIDEKSMAIAWIIFMFLAGIIGITLIIIGRETPSFLPIGWTLLGSTTAIALFFVIAKFYLNRKMGGKE